MRCKDVLAHVHSTQPDALEIRGLTATRRRHVGKPLRLTALDDCSLQQAWPRLRARKRPWSRHGAATAAAAGGSSNGAGTQAADKAAHAQAHPQQLQPVQEVAEECF